MYIKDLLKQKRTLSFEFFPPKEHSQEAVLFETVTQLQSFSPDFVSITYGAGGSTRDKTINWIRTLKNSHGFNTMMHLTCYGSTPELIDSLCASLVEYGISNVLVLRGDPSNNQYDNTNLHFSYANELVSYIADRYPALQIGVAGYPEKHIQSPDFASDIRHLKQKLDAGAGFIVTQLFFDNTLFYRFLDRIRKAGIHAPVVAGIMPVISYGQVVRFTQMCGAAIPPPLLAKLEKASASDAAGIGEDHALAQCRGLSEQGVDGIHYYTLNRHTSVRNILRQLH